MNDAPLACLQVLYKEDCKGADPPPLLPNLYAPAERERVSE